MKAECYKCNVVFETASESTKMCPACSKDYRVKMGITKPEGWERKTEDSAAYQRAYRQSHKDKFSQYEKRRTPRTAEEEREKYIRKMKKLHGDDWLPRNERIDPLKEVKRKAMVTYRNAVKRGKIVRQPCFVCGALEVDGHHPDYSRPLDVVWLCKTHHKEVHKQSPCV